MSPADITGHCRPAHWRHLALVRPLPQTAHHPSQELNCRARKVSRTRNLSHTRVGLCMSSALPTELHGCFSAVSCSSSSTGAVSADPDDCQAFWACHNDTIHRWRCFIGDAFDEAEVTCKPITEVTRWETTPRPWRRGQLIGVGTGWGRWGMSCLFQVVLIPLLSTHCDNHEAQMSETN